MMMVSSSVRVQGQQPEPIGSKRAITRCGNTKNSGSVNANASADRDKEKYDSVQTQATSSPSNDALSTAIRIVDSTTDIGYLDDSICRTNQDIPEHQQNSLFQTVSPILVKPTDGSERIRAKKRELEQKVASWRIGISAASKMGRRRSTGTCDGGLSQFSSCNKHSDNVFETMDAKYPPPPRVSRRHSVDVSPVKPRRAPDAKYPSPPRVSRELDAKYLSPPRVSRRHSMDVSPVKPRRALSPSRSNRTIDGDESIISMLDFSALRTNQTRDNPMSSHTINSSSSMISVGSPPTRNANSRASLRSMTPSPSIPSNTVLRSTNVKTTSTYSDNKKGVAVPDLGLKQASSKTLDTCGSSSFGTSSSGGNAAQSGEQHCLVVALDDSLPPLDPIYPDDDTLKRKDEQSLTGYPEIGGSASITVSREPESMHSTTSLSEAGTIISVTQKDLELKTSHTARRRSMSGQQDRNRHTRPERRRSTGMGYDITRIHARIPVLVEHTDSFHLRPVEKKGSRRVRQKAGRQQRRSSTGGFVPVSADISSPCPSRKTVRQNQRRNSTGCVPSSPSRSSSVSELAPPLKSKSTIHPCLPPRHSQTRCEVPQSSLDGRNVSVPRYPVASSRSPARKHSSGRRRSAGLPMVTGTTKDHVERRSSTGSSNVSGAMNRSSFRRRFSTGSSLSKIELSTDDEAESIPKLHTSSKRTKGKKKDSKKSRRWSLSMFRLGHPRSEE